MQGIEFPTTARAIGTAFSASIVGDPEMVVHRIASLDKASDQGPGALTFLADRKFLPQLNKLNHSVVLTTEDLSRTDLPVTFLVVADPKRAFAEIAKQFLPVSPWKGISPAAHIHPAAKIGKEVNIAPFAVICEDAEIGDGTTIYPSAYVGPKVSIGKNCEIYPSVSLITNVRIGDRVRIFAGSVLGSEGFGFLEGQGGFTAMPQIGWVIIEDDVRIGAKCTIDRGTLGETRVKRGTILDDQVHIGHNCVVGQNCALCAQVGLAGSTILEDQVLLGGQVGLAGHLTVGKGARVAGQSGSSSNLEAGKTYLSSPAMPIEEALKVFRTMRKLPELATRIRQLEKQIPKEIQNESP